MSEWFEIKDADNVDLSKDGEEMHILFNTNNFGNQYVSVPIKYIRAVLSERGRSQYPDDEL